MTGRGIPMYSPRTVTQGNKDKNKKVKPKLDPNNKVNGTENKPTTPVTTKPDKLSCNKHTPATDNATPAERGWVKCDKCPRWIAYYSTGLEDQIGPYDETKLRDTNYICDFCTLTVKLNQLTEENATLKHTVSLLREKFEGDIKDMDKRIEASATCTQKDVKTYADSVKVLNEELTNIKQEKLSQDAIVAPPINAMMVKQTGNELREIEKRKNNVIVFGLKESDDDKKIFTDYANRFHVLSNLLDEEDILSVERLGQVQPKTDKPRLLRLKLSSQAKRKMILTMHQHKRSMTEEDPSNTNNKVFIRPDLTKLQQESDKKLREEQVRLGKDRYVISKGKLVLRSTVRNAPTIRKKSSNDLNTHPIDQPKAASTANQKTCSNIEEQNDSRGVSQGSHAHEDPKDNNLHDEEISFKPHHALTFTNSKIRPPQDPFSAKSHANSSKEQTKVQAKENNQQQMYDEMSTIPPQSSYRKLNDHSTTPQFSL